MKQTAIRSLTGFEILDSRGRPTVQARIELEDGTTARANVPSGASTGKHEALELRDHEDRYRGFGVRKAIQNLEGEILQSLHGMDATDQTKVDTTMHELDGTPNFGRLGANAVLAVSLVAARASARATGTPLFRYLREKAGTTGSIHLPYPMMNILNGGVHADNRLSIQEYQIIPRVQSFAERVRLGSEVYMKLGETLHTRNYSTLVGDEGGYAPRLANNAEGFAVIRETLRSLAVSPAEVGLGCDVASTYFYNADLGQYFLSPEGLRLSPLELIDLYRQWDESYDLLSIEDGLAEDDWENWRKLTATFRTGVMLIGDDLFVTSPARLQRGIDQHIANAILVKPNQVGTLTDVFTTVHCAREHGYAVIISHRSGETEDPFIADLAVGVGAEYLKAGSVARSERTAKYNRLLAIEQALGA